MIHQICHSEESRQSLDPGFTMLDNLRNERPDWREYWPIRNFLLRENLAEDTHYGFFSPKFKLKTGLDSQTVRDFVGQQSMAADVILFCPFFDEGAAFLNVLEQGSIAHHEAHCR